MTPENELLVLKKEVKQLATKLDFVDRELRRTQKAQTEFLTRMSHELNSPLNIIIGFSQLLEASELSEEQQDSVKEILDAANYLNQQNQHLFKLALAKNSPLSISDVEVGHVLSDALQSFSDVVARKHIKIDVADIFQTLTIKNDKQYLEQVMNNLVLNAVHYTDVEGTVTVDAKSADGEVTISVQDQGAGIPEQLYPEVFTLFHDRNVENVEGLGMGLYLAKEYVELMGGEIGFESNNGIGTVFWVTLPKDASNITI